MQSLGDSCLAEKPNLVPRLSSTISPLTPELIRGVPVPIRDTPVLIRIIRWPIRLVEQGQPIYKDELPYFIQKAPDKLD